MFVLEPHYKSLQFPTFLRVHPPPSALGSRSQTRKRSLEMLTVERADYTQEMDCHYFNSWSVHRWIVYKSWLVLMGQLNIVVLEYLQHLPCLSARAVGRAWTGNSRTDSPSNRFYASLATRMFPLLWIKTVFFFCILTIAPLLIVENVAPLFILLI